MAFIPAGQAEPGVNYANPSVALPDTQPKEVKIELPPYTRLSRAAAHAPGMDKLIDAWANEQQIDFHFEHNREKDYVIPLPDGKVAVVAETVTINGFQFLIYAGRNRLPKSVYEFLMECPDQKRRMHHMLPDQNICYGQITKS